MVDVPSQLTCSGPWDAALLRWGPNLEDATCRGVTIFGWSIDRTMQPPSCAAKQKCCSEAQAGWNDLLNMDKAAALSQQACQSLPRCCCQICDLVSLLQPCRTDAEAACPALLLKRDDYSVTCKRTIGAWINWNGIYSTYMLGQGDLVIYGRRYFCTCVTYRQGICYECTDESAPASVQSRHLLWKCLTLAKLVTLRKAPVLE